ncbi:universal stress protein [Nitrosomonas marina]|uniref:Nucleotide-binding universal stress protein, UspA family n=1 Tax=Nitrosomonas marina TaxID=917 RepID=A0A1H8CX87_9PROT|nr:universal stress protein [Nitrosomonas marina]SEM99064.1 Nucleotide-binding universal stress protein, UspA family [Nitrosomonas marina]
MESKKLLVTTDFSDVSFAALTYAAKMQGHQITLISILQTGDVPPDLLKQMPDPGAIQDYRKKVLEQTREKLESVARQFFSNTNVTTDVVVCDEDVAAEICAYADDNAIDMIVMTGQGRGALGSLFVGSTVQKVLRMAKIPVLVIPKTAK